VHRVEHIEVLALAPAFFDAVAAHIGDRGAELSLTVTEGQLYVTIDGETIEGAVTRVPLTA
jgi:hypothetical protein